MPNIYVSDSEMEAIEYFQGLAHFLSEGPVTDEWMKEYAEASAQYAKFESKFLKAKKAEYGGAFRSYRKTHDERLQLTRKISL